MVLFYKKKEKDKKMQIAKESIFISSIRVFFNTVLAVFAVFLTLIPIFMFFSIFSDSDGDINLKNKFEILPDLEGNTKPLATGAPCVLRIDINQDIGKGGISASDIYYQLIESRKAKLKNNRVKAVLLNINSPGGDAIESDSIYRDLLKYKGKYNVPVYCYIEGMCASGGYYIACASDKINSAPLGITGSVGVFFGPFFNFKNLMDKVGVDSKYISDGKNKLTLNPYGTWKEDEGKYLETVTNSTYERFIDIVSKARNIDKDKLINEYGAKVFNTKDALEIKYIDQVSSYDETLKELLEKANIDIEKPYQVVTLKPKKNWVMPMLLNTKASFKSFLKEYLLTLLTH
jgi:protease-4